MVDAWLSDCLKDGPAMPPKGYGIIDPRLFMLIFPGRTTPEFLAPEPKPERLSNLTPFVSNCFNCWMYVFACKISL